MYIGKGLHDRPFEHFINARQCVNGNYNVKYCYPLARFITEWRKPMYIVRTFRYNDDQAACRMETCGLLCFKSELLNVKTTYPNFLKFICSKDVTKEHIRQILGKEELTNCCSVLDHKYVEDMFNGNYMKIDFRTHFPKTYQ